MAVSGFWFVLTMPDETVDQLRPRVDPVLEGAAAEASAQAEWRAWLEDPGQVEADPFWNMPLQNGDCMTDVGESELVGSVNGLGPGRARLLTGFLGSFLLSAAELQASRAAIDAAFRLTDAERVEVLARMQAWTETYVGSDAVGLEECLGLLPRGRRPGGLGRATACSASTSRTSARNPCRTRSRPGAAAGRSRRAGRRSRERSRSR
ncbi:MAG TPA: hypothetical protein VGF23_16250 [Gaiellaceae bacterium]|jgi:hypothetical protein